MKFFKNLEPICRCKVCGQLPEIEHSQLTQFAQDASGAYVRVTHLYTFDCQCLPAKLIGMDSQKRYAFDEAFHQWSFRNLP